MLFVKYFKIVPMLRHHISSILRIRFRIVLGSTICHLVDLSHRLEREVRSKRGIV